MVERCNGLAQQALLFVAKWSLATSTGIYRPDTTVAFPCFNHYFSLKQPCSVAQIVTKRNRCATRFGFLVVLSTSVTPALNKGSKFLQTGQQMLLQQPGAPAHSSTQTIQLEIWSAVGPTRVAQHRCCSGGQRGATVCKLHLCIRVNLNGNDSQPGSPVSQLHNSVLFKSERAGSPVNTSLYKYSHVISNIFNCSVTVVEGSM